MKKLSIIAVLISLLLTTSEAWARKTSSRLAEGFIQSINHEKQTLVIKSDSESLVFVWNDWTKFFENGESFKVASLKPGTKVDYWYRAPLFGDHFVTKVAWENSQDLKKENQHEK